MHDASIGHVTKIAVVTKKLLFERRKRVCGGIDFSPRCRLEEHCISITWPDGAAIM